jgi:ribosomal subunit interface protein
MKIIIKKITDSTPAFETYIEKKLLPLAKLIKPFERNGETEVALDVIRTSRHHGKGDEVFMAAADLRLPKKIIRAEEYAASMRVAIDRVRDTLKIEIEKYRTQFVEIDRKKLDKNK